MKLCSSNITKANCLAYSIMSRSMPDSKMSSTIEYYARLAISQDITTFHTVLRPTDQEG